MNHPEDFLIEVTTPKSTRQALVALWKAAQAAGWIVVNDNDLSGLVSNGAMDIKSLGICHPDLARPFLASDYRTALCMPCNVIIFRDGEMTRMVAMRPTRVIPRLFHHVAGDVEPTAEEVDRALLEILQSAAETT